MSDPKKPTVGMTVTRFYSGERLDGSVSSTSEFDASADLPDPLDDEDLSAFDFA